MYRILILLSLGLACAPPPQAAPCERGIPARVLKVIDGDTIKVRAKIWVRLRMTANARIRGVDAPEIRGAKCAQERKRGEAARDYVRLVIGRGKRVCLLEVKDDKYGGRVTATVQLPDGRDLARLLIDAGHGRRYTRGRRRKWC